MSNPDPLEALREQIKQTKAVKAFDHTIHNELTNEIMELVSATLEAVKLEARIDEIRINRKYMVYGRADARLRELVGGGE
jgi:hypothetical protein